MITCSAGSFVGTDFCLIFTPRKATVSCLTSPNGKHYGLFANGTGGKTSRWAASPRNAGQHVEARHAAISCLMRELIGEHNRHIFRCSRFAACSIQGHDRALPQWAGASGQHAQRVRIVSAETCCLFGNLAQDHAVTCRLLLRHEPEPSGKIALLLKTGAIADRRHDGSGGTDAPAQSSGTGNCHPVGPVLRSRPIEL